MYTPLWIDKPKIIKCWNCGKLLWVEDLQEYSGERESWYLTDKKQTSGFTINPNMPMWHDYAKLTQDDYHYIIKERLYRQTLNEQEVRSLAFWARNDIYRYPVGWFDYTVENFEKNCHTLIEIGPRVKDPDAGSFENATPREIENMEALIEIIVTANLEESAFLHAELLRELGRFSEALEVLGNIPMVEGNENVYINMQRGLCNDKCTCVREVVFPEVVRRAPSTEDIEKEKQQKEQRFQKWKAIVAKEKADKLGK